MSAPRVAPLTQTCVLLGVPVDDVTIDEAVDRIAAMVETGRSDGRVHQVATVNVDFLVNAVADADVLRVLQRTALNIPDGMPVVWASRLLGSPLRERTTGIDLLPAVAARCAAAGHRMVLFGGAPGVADRAADVLRARAPGLDVVVVEAPAVAPDGTTDPAAVAAVRALRPDVVCVALGNPKQERWIERNGREVGAPVLIGVGGSLDFLAGATRRAPTWMQRAGLEWLHRAASEPRRLVGRYARDFRRFVPGVARQAWAGRRRGEAIAPGVEVDGDQAVLRVLGPVPLADPEPAVRAHVLDGGDLVIDVSGAGRLDNASASALAALARSVRRHGGHTAVVGNGSWPGAGGPGDLFDGQLRDPGSRGDQ